MTHDQSPDEDEAAARHGRGGTRLLVAGVIGACALGVGLGLWARPSGLERGDGPPPPKPEAEAEAGDRTLQIVLDDTPEPVGQPMEVMSAELASHAAARTPPLELLVPAAPPAGLMKVDAPGALPVTFPARETFPARGSAPPAAAPPQNPKKPADERADSQPKTRASSRKVEVAEKPAAPRPQAKTSKRPAKDEPRKLARSSKAERETKVAKAEPRPSKIGKEPPARLEKLAKAVKKKAAEAEGKTRREISQAETRLAEKTRAARTARVAAGQKAAPRSAQAKAQPKSPQKAAAPTQKAAPRGEGPMRVARNEACASPDPGEALVCADPRLHQRDRQLQRAFRNAEAAGVPASALQRQQERWRLARAAAARDGPWAVEDVYEARIAELHDLARDARDE